MIASGASAIPALDAAAGGGEGGASVPAAAGGRGRLHAVFHILCYLLKHAAVGGDRKMPRLLVDGAGGVDSCRKYGVQILLLHCFVAEILGGGDVGYQGDGVAVISYSIILLVNWCF